MAPEAARFNFFFIVWSQVRLARANMVMIVKTARAVALARPDWNVELRFSEMNVPEEEIYSTFSIQRPPNLVIGTIFPPEYVIKHAEMGHVFRGQVRPSHEELLRACSEYWIDRLAEGPSIIYTRNVALVEFFRRIGGPQLPIILELHQLKYHGLVRGGIPGSGLPELKRALHAARQSELVAIARADYLFCISQSMRQRIVRGNPGMRVAILPSAAEVSLLADDAPEERPEERPIDLIYTGQLYHWKGVHTLIEALRWLPPHVRLTLIGGNDIYDIYALRTFARNLGLGARIHWRGQLPHRDVLALQHQAKIGLVPLPFKYPIARWYTSPIKIFELMAAGAALLVSSVPALRDLLIADEHACFARPDDPRDWARQIERLLADEPLRRYISAHARRMVAGLTFDARARTIIDQVESPADIISPKVAACSPVVG